MSDTDIPKPEANTGDIKRLLTLRKLDDNIFRNRVNELNINGTLFGGQVLAQSLRAALYTVDGRPAHSMHGYFVRPGDAERPVIYEVERTRDGKSFTTRRVTAIQHGVAIFHMEASFHPPEAGLEHETPSPQAAVDPETLLDMDGLAERYGAEVDETTRSRLRGHGTIEVRPVDPEALLLQRGAKDGFWLRIPSAEGGDADLNACALAYASDFWLAPAARMRHARPFDFHDYQLASLDHAMWFHRPVSAAEWFLYETDSPWAGNGRGLARGAMYDRAGHMIASTAQEALMRRRSGA